TNVPPHGAFRGFGAPQSLFAMERHMDRIAQAVGLSPIEVRRRNFLRPGQTTTTDQEVREPIDLAKLLDRALELSDYRSKKQRSHCRITHGHGRGQTGAFGGRWDQADIEAVRLARRLILV